MYTKPFKFFALRLSYLVFLSLFVQPLNVALAESASLYQRLNKLDGVEVVDVSPLDGYLQGYSLLIEQPLDHANPQLGTFKQRVYLGHLDEQQPVVLETDGYSISDYPEKELPGIVRGNLLAVEYRFYGESTPENGIPWQFLSIQQGAADHHRIIDLFKQIYPGPWLSSGYSKGGESALFHRMLYPNDVIATVTYDAPLILGTEDLRTNQFIDNKVEELGDCGKEMLRFQRELLERRPQMIAALKHFAQRKQWEFTIGFDVALEYAALEYTFSFLQRGQQCNSIPAKGAEADLFIQHIQEGGGFWVYSDKGIKRLEPSFYQHFTQMGYYGFTVDNVADLLRAVPNPSNRDFLPKGVSVDFDATFIPAVIDWLQQHGQNIIYLYGENDPWFAAAVDHGDATNAFTVVESGGYHASKIRNLPEFQQEEIFQALEAWLEVPVTRDR